MSTIAESEFLVSEVKSQAAIQESIETTVDELIATLPDPRQLTSDQRRGIIARYSSVLEGNFIYWMTATLIATKAENARPIIMDNLREETRDAHPHMMRKFAMEADAFPTDRDALAVHDDLTKMRLFLGHLCGVQSLASMAFFEGFIQKFMPFLAALAAEQGSKEMEYTDVHGVCDIAHTAGLYEALWKEMAVNPLPEEADVMEGVWLLRDLLQQIVRPESSAA
ncbi:MAG TPA: iron-containing redox enzyme family protein [Acidobacteriaceae bacterium]|jgi:hypothetical protein|nr:iron-containing redox enzyme family protein [Acidobacteriaceae bacterium]